MKKFPFVRANTNIMPQLFLQKFARQQNVNKMPTDLTTSIAKEAARKANAIQQRNRMKQR